MAKRKQSSSESGEIQIALLPEIATARVGSAADPVDCYEWVGPDDRPDGTGKTFVAKRPTLVVGDDGVITSHEPEGWNEDNGERNVSTELESCKDDPVEFAIVANDGKSQAIRPVAPWFVVCMKKGDDWVPLKPSDLGRRGAATKDISWHVFVANRKAYNMTLALEDIVYAETEVVGEEYAKHYSRPARHLIEKPLIGRSDADYWKRYPPVDKLQIDAFDPKKSLVPAEEDKEEDRFRFGRIQVPQTSEEHGIRLRFIPPRGEVYGPTGLRAKIDSLTKEIKGSDKANNFDNWQALNLLEDADFEEVKQSVAKIVKDKGLRLPDGIADSIDDAKRLTALSHDEFVLFSKKIKTIIDVISVVIVPDDGFHSDELSQLAEDAVKKLRLAIDGGRKKTYCVLNNKSAWANKILKPDGENRTFPQGQFAYIQLADGSHALGLLDDFCDGIVKVTIALQSGKVLSAEARVIVGPPDLAPDRRHPMPIQAALDDRRYLADFDISSTYYTNPQRLTVAQVQEVRAEVADLFRRVNEIIGLTNLDATNWHFGKPLFPVDPRQVALDQLPLSQKARETHRRLASIESLEQTFREYANRDHPQHLNFDDPNDPRGLFNLPPGENGEVPDVNNWDRMLVLLRGSQMGPLHLTKRQIAVLKLWLEMLKKPWN